MTNPAQEQGLVEEQQIDDQTQIMMPGVMHPSFKFQLSKKNGVLTNLLIGTWGGIGDIIAAEPTIRYACDHFHDCHISVLTPHPQIFNHLRNRIKEFLPDTVQPDLNKYYWFNTIMPPESLTCQFISPMLTHAVDFPSMCAFRMQLPIKDREIMLQPEDKDKQGVTSEILDIKKRVIIHPGKHWPSKTFPRTWWDDVILNVAASGCVPVLIGTPADKSQVQGTVNVDTSWCQDYRGKLSLMESVHILQQSKVLLTNDSSPLHMAASGDCAIGFLATAKHHDFLFHWRHGQFGWNMHNFSKGGMWEVSDYFHCPNSDKPVVVDQVSTEILKSWLPDPKEFAAWACEHA